MKYIIFETPSGLDFPIVFPEYRDHSDVAKLNKEFPGLKLASAGFCSVHKDINDETQASCWGHSVTLKVKSRPEDNYTLTQLFRRT